MVLMFITVHLGMRLESSVMVCGLLKPGAIPCIHWISHFGILSSVATNFTLTSNSCTIETGHYP